MDQKADSLLADWIRLAGPDNAQYGRDLIARYQENHRHYHTTEHLRHILGTLDRLGEAAPDPDAVRYAAWFHDVVYDIAADSPLSNEERSARLAENVLKAMHADPALITETGRLVRVTADHRPDTRHVNGQILCDADLAILGADPDDYLRYCAQVREEYRVYPDDQFRPGRTAVLRTILDRPAIFRTGAGRDLFEDAARRNIKAEIDRLAGPA
ncbi:MAG TPA: metal-dependent phosphohydrolase [Actinocrinis sp.]|nr:metal-dependent phosphohydrolase [Actinocrinis sp.]